MEMEYGEVALYPCCTGTPLLNMVGGCGRILDCSVLFRRRCDFDLSSSVMTAARFCMSMR